MERSEFEGIAHLHASVLVEELRRDGVSLFCLSPGARILPVVRALAENAGVRVTLCNDERSAGFWAQGVGKGGGVACVCCTSGTAAANYLPAVIEARLSQTPLVVLTAERPIELLYAKANQTIDQSSVFGSFPLLTLNIPAPESQLHLHSLLANIDQAVHIARSQRGPVHLNVAYRKPFFGDHFSIDTLPADEVTLFRSWRESTEPHCRYPAVRGVVDVESMHEVAQLIDKAEAPLIVCGPVPVGAARDGIFALAQRLGAPLFADVHSGLRFGETTSNVVGGYNLFLERLETLPDLVLLFGDRIISEPLRRYLDRATGSLVQVASFPYRQDAIENEFLYPALRIVADPMATAAMLATAVDQRPEGLLLKQCRELEAAAASRVEALFDRSLQEGSIVEPQAVRSIFRLAPEGSALFASASLPLREVEYFAETSSKDIAVGCNRGATGIDGIVSSALGFADALNRPLSVIIGDQALLHDLTALSLVRGARRPVWIFVLQNHGGAIFNLFPLGALEPLMVNSHSYSFRDAAALFGIGYSKPDSLDDLVHEFRAAQQAGSSMLFELVTDGKQTVELFRQSEVLV
ncbi:MAG: 2-succinyl-5-enolpyruvyl-6-hydroxy-3-cyclohexene-1-carboxylic-acid synthase [Bdellovibrionales bacterium]|nr:2-succinyl-5-enolpyruvyl-6-hydroxy-3-cyclohexene-1-carboxylic-acid synthase [Bdellovibrionales bacterium]